MTLLHRSSLVLALVLAAADGCAASPGGPIEYVVSLTAPQTQMVDLSIRVPDVTGAVLDLALPVWRPGRYVVLDPAGTVRAVRAFGPGDRDLRIEKIDKATWRVTTDGATEVRVDYRVYANSIRDRTRHVDDTHAFLSPSSVFMYAPARRRDPVRVVIDAPSGWRIATGLDADPADPSVLLAADYDVLVDSPIEVGLHDVLEFDLGDARHEIVIWPPGVEYDGDKLVADFRLIVEEQASIFGRLPYRRYVFLMHVGAGGGGTEHLNSTIMQTSRAALEGSLDDGKAYRRFLGLVSHEFFHTWNVKQLRPAGIHPYDYQRENYSKLLWVAEGTTSYYDELVLARAGLLTPSRYLRKLGEAIDALRGRPGAAVQSLESSSFDAWIKFNRSTPDDVNSTISFYRKGALVSLLLDMEIRGRTAGDVSLDDVMREMFERFPLAGPGYAPEDLVATVEAMTGSSFAAFFAAYVEGTAPLPLEAALAHVGLELVRKAAKADDDESDDDDEESDESDNGREEDAEPAAGPDRAYLGVLLRASGNRTIVRAALADGPAYAAGVQAGDELVALDGRRLPAGDLDTRLERREPGDVVTIHLMRRDELRTLRVTLAARPSGAWTVRRLTDVTDEQKATYEGWIGQPW